MAVQMIKVGVVGATGYTGAELLRLLAKHPAVEVATVTSRGEEGRSVASLYPSLRGHDWVFEAPDNAVLEVCDVVFFATPNGVAMTQAESLLRAGVRVIDLGADFRLSDPTQWANWYGQPHVCPNLLEEAVYGLPEVHREQIKTARLVANPGCYPTSIQIPLLPLLSQDLIESEGIISDSKSGVSGAGRKASFGNLYSEVNENFKAYGVSGHRHLPEIIEGLGRSGKNVHDFTFVPHLVPMTRGIFSTIYARLKEGVSVVDVCAALEALYNSQPFVDVYGQGDVLETRFVTGSNRCAINVSSTTNPRQVVITSVIDNLLKGAAGQAVQNMNLMFGCCETEGLELVAWLP